MTAKFKWSSERDGILRRMKAADAFNWEIGKELGCSAHAVRRRWARLHGKSSSKKVRILPSDAEPCQEGDAVAFLKQDMAFQAAMRAAIVSGAECRPFTPAWTETLPKRLSAVSLSSGCSSPAGLLADIGRRGGNGW